MSMGTVTATTTAGAGMSGHTRTGGRLVALDGRTLPLRGVSLRAEAAAGIARTVLVQRFANPWQEALQVTYSVPLPAEGVVGGYAFLLGDRRVVGEVDRRAAARARFEQAVIEGRTAALLDQERANLFTQEVGNVPPGQEVTVELTIDQKLRWLGEGAWEWRFPTVAPPRYLGAEGRVADAAAVTMEVADGTTGVRASMELSIADALAEGRSPESPTHPVTARRAGGGIRVALPEEGAALDRDVVVRWAVAKPEVGLSLGTARPAAGAHGGHAYGLLTVMPPAGQPQALPRDLVVLLDTSGSMGGQPLAHARRVVAALVDGLVEHDRLELIAFSSEPERWKAGPVSASPAAKAEALRWLAALEAGGGTEMASAVTLALRPLRAGAQRQVVLVTDGHIGFEQEVVREVLQRLPEGSRLHTVGVGSSVNRALTGPAARAGHGVEFVVDLDEDAERGAARLVSATRLPLVVDLAVEGEAVAGRAPRRLPDLLAGAPALLSLKLRPEGGGLIVRGRTAAGPWEARLQVAPTDPGQGSGAITALFGREAVEDLEMEIASGADARERNGTIERLGLEFQIATRLTSWIAVSQEVTVDAQAPVRRERMPQELPYGLSAEGLGLRVPAPPPMMAAGGMVAQAMHRMLAAGVAPVPAMRAAPARPSGARAKMSAARPVAPAAKARTSILGRVADALLGLGERAGAGGGGDDEEAADLPAAPFPTEEKGEGRGETFGLEDVERLAREMEPEPIAPAPVLTAKAEAARVRRSLYGRRIGPAGGPELIVEAAVDGPALAWSPAAQAELVLADGTRLLVAVETARSTRAGDVAGGAAFRIAVALPPGLEGAVPAALEIESAGVLVRIEIR